MNANLLRRWVVEEDRDREAGLIAAGNGSPAPAIVASAAFVPVELPRPSVETAQEIVIELRRGATAGEGELAARGSGGLQCLAARVAAVIRIDAVWLAVEPLDMRAGTETALARVVRVFGEARAHHAYLFVNRRSNRIKVLVHDGIGIWLCARRLHQGRFVWASAGRVHRWRSATSSCRRC